MRGGPQIPIDGRAELGKICPVLVGWTDMQRTKEHAIRQALEARQRAIDALDNHVRDEWNYIARMWEELAQACEAVSKAQERALLETLPIKPPSHGVASSH